MTPSERPVRDAPSRVDVCLAFVWDAGRMGMAFTLAIRSFLERDPRWGIVLMALAVIIIGQVFWPPGAGKQP